MVKNRRVVHIGIAILTGFVYFIVVHLITQENVRKESSPIIPQHLPVVIYYLPLVIPNILYGVVMGKDKDQKIKLSIIGIAISIIIFFLFLVLGMINNYKGFD